MGMKNVTIYIPLLDEGVDVWRPVDAVWDEGEIYTIISEKNNETENWGFVTGQKVRCRERLLSGGIYLVAYGSA
jgi:hypothetical protein